MKAHVAGVLIGLLLGAIRDDPGRTGRPEYQFPRLREIGGVVDITDAAEQPRRASKVLFDVSGEASTGDVQAGLKRVARFINLYASTGINPDQMRLAVVLRDQAIRAALTDDAFARRANARSNPNAELIRQLREMGVELFVDAQSLAQETVPADEVMPQVTIASSSMVVAINRQMEGFAYVYVPD